jgi:hypothetical protein
VFDLVRWSFLVTLTPMALGLAWRLILLVANSIAVGFARPPVEDEPEGPLLAVNRQRTSSSLSVSGWTPSRERNDPWRRRGSLEGLRGC